MPAPRPLPTSPWLRLHRRRRGLCPPALPPPQPPPPQDAPDADTARSQELQALKRLIEDIYEGDVAGAFREYCVAEPAWAGAVEMLDADGGAGWELLQQLVDCRKGELTNSVSAQGLLDSNAWFQ